jgi:hypothetical protein
MEAFVFPLHLQERRCGMKRLTLFAAVVFILFSYSTAFGDWVQITLEAIHEDAALPTISTIVEVDDPSDQLDMSREAAEFALEGWNLQSYGGWLQYREPPSWVGHFYFVDIPVSGLGSPVSGLLGYELNVNALTYGRNFYLYFHTDETVGRLSHQVCETPNNYGVISGGMGGYWAQCTIATWGTFTVEPIALAVAFDIKTGSCPNPLNVKSKGVLPVAIMGTADFDVMQIDPATLSLGLKNGDANGGVAPLQWAFADVGEPYEPYTGKEDCELDCTGCSCPDGFDDLVVNFARQELVAYLGEVADGDCLVLQITGNLLEEFGGTPIYGEDVLLILKKGK